MSMWWPTVRVFSACAVRITNSLKITSLYEEGEKVIHIPLTKYCKHKVGKVLSCAQT